MNNAEGLSGRPHEPSAAFASFPGEDAQDFFQANDNHFGTLEALRDEAAKLWKFLGFVVIDDRLKQCLNYNASTVHEYSGGISIYVCES